MFRSRESTNSSVAGPGTNVLTTVMSPDSPCRTKSSTIDPSSARAVAVPIDSKAADSTPIVAYRISLTAPPRSGGDDVIEHRDRELAQRGVDLADAGLNRGIDRRRITGEQSLVDVVAGELRCLDQVAEIDE